MELRLVFDTNVYINNLSRIEKIIKQNNQIKILVPRIVIHELDILKASHHTARKAIHFLSTSGNVILEGTDDKMDIECETDPVIQNLEKGNNDDKILKFVYDNYNSILVTGDRSLLLKAKSLKIIHIDFNNEFTENLNQNFTNSLVESMEIESDVKKINTAPIEHFILEIAEKYNLGVKKLEKLTLTEKLEFMIRNFQYYSWVLSSNSKDEIVRIKNELTSNINTEGNIARLMVILGVAFR